jgi:hypothetical protein
VTTKKTATKKPATTESKAQKPATNGPRSAAIDPASEGATLDFLMKLSAQLTRIEDQDTSFRSQMNKRFTVLERKLEAIETSRRDGPDLEAILTDRFAALGTFLEQTMSRALQGAAGRKEPALGKALERIEAMISSTEPPDGLARIESRLGELSSLLTAAITERSPTALTDTPDLPEFNPEEAAARGPVDMTNIQVGFRLLLRDLQRQAEVLRAVSADVRLPSSALEESVERLETVAVALSEEVASIRPVEAGRMSPTRRATSDIAAASAARLVTAGAELRAAVGAIRRSDMHADEALPDALSSIREELSALAQDLSETAHAIKQRFDAQAA